MADTNALLTVEQAVTRFLLKYKKPTEDYITYIELACNAIRDFSLYHGGDTTAEKMTVDSNKWIDMPDSMIGFNDLCIPIDGEWWSFTERKAIVNTTTFTGLVEGRDSDSGEGVAIRDALTSGYGARGGVNDYNYTIDWKQRRIYLDGIDSGTVVLIYTTSGISTTASTYISDLLTPVIDSYLLWRETYWQKDLVREREMRGKEYEREVLKARNFINSLTYNQLRDLLLSSATQTAKR